jgi:hypothetical protein
MGKNTFNIIILNGRPASGKSEVIDYLKKVPVTDRVKRFHIGEFEEIDDFPMLWTWYEDDAILEKIMHKPRINTTDESYFLYDYQWQLLIERISLEYSKRLRDNENYHDSFTTFIEFSRGAEHGGYREAYLHLSDEILKKAAIFYIDVPWEESLRKNRKRFNPEKPDSILEHGLPDSKLERLYRDVDWPEFTGDDPEFVMVKGHKIPYVVLDNDPDITTPRDEKLGRVLEQLFGKLWKIRK